MRPSLGREDLVDDFDVMRRVDSRQGQPVARVEVAEQGMRHDACCALDVRVARGQFPDHARETGMQRTQALGVGSGARLHVLGRLGDAALDASGAEDPHAGHVRLAVRTDAIVAAVEQEADGREHAPHTSQRVLDLLTDAPTRDGGRVAVPAVAVCYQQTLQPIELIGQMAELVHGLHGTLHCCRHGERG